MTSTISQGFEQVYVHPSQFPDKVYQDYLAGFSSRQINYKFHYDSVKQSQKWLRIHETFSPAINSDDCVQAHEKCFQKTAEILENSLSLQLIGLCCGGGKKDSLLASHLLKTKRKLVYYPVDVSLSLALISAQKVRTSYPKLSVQPIVCDLLHSQDLILHLNSRKEGQTKIITFFGTLHNFCPDQILPVLSHYLQKGDILLLSTNLAPGNDYVQGIQQVLPQYDNELTKDWLITVLMDAGINQEDGTIKFSIEDDKKNQDLKRIHADFEVENDVSFKLDDQLIQWKNGDKVQLFFSYRYTTPKLQVVLNSYDIKILDYWEAANQEEGIYLCQKI